MRKIAITLLMLMAAAAAFAAFDAQKSDDLFYHQEAFEEDRDYLLSSLEGAESDSDRAAIL